MTPSTFIWHNGELKAWQDATVHVSAHALHYGSSVFEGLRVYACHDGPAFFRLPEHTHRLFDSARIHGLDIGYSPEQIDRACHATVAANGLKAAYVRPIVFAGAGGLGVVPSPDAPVELVILAFEWGSYLGEAAERGADVCVSSWQRPAPNTMPAWAKAGGNYLSSQLISREAQRNGYDEGIALGTNGLLSEGAGENLFLVRDGELLTPPASAGILAGITRASVLSLAADLGLKARECELPREALYTADEAFFTGTAAEITPIRSVDRQPIGSGQPGPITLQLRQAFFGLFNGQTPDRHGWLERLDLAAAQEWPTRNLAASA